MKSKVKNKKVEQAEKPFPKLMISEILTTTIVLFSKQGLGVVVNQSPSTSIKLGDFSEVWSMDAFKDFDGKVTLSND